MKKILINAFAGLIIVFFVICLCGSMLYVGFKPYVDYAKHKDVVVPVTASVTRITEHEDSDDDEYYKLYVSYSYDGKKYNDTYWKKEYSLDYKTEDEVSIKIDPENPRYILNEEQRGSGMIMLLIVIIAVMMVTVSEVYYNKNLKKDEEQKYITDRMIAYDLRPTFRIDAARILISAGIGVLLCGKLMRGIFGAVEYGAAIVSIIIGVILQIMAVYVINRLHNTQYTFARRICEKKWIDDSDIDTTLYYVKFQGVNQKSIPIGEYNQMCEGSSYYIVANSKNDVRNIYPASIWRSAVNDRTLGGAERVLAKKVWLELFLSVPAVAVFVSVMAGITNLFV